MRKCAFLAVILILTAGGISSARPGAQTAPAGVPPIQAPLHPDVARLLRLQGSLLPGAIVAGTHDAVRLTAASAPMQAEALPAYYDLRALNKMTPVRNEGVLGGSTVFAALASLESSLKPSEVWDFSEQHLRAGLLGTVSLDAVVGALARWTDPIRESDDPWPAAIRDDSAVKHVQNVAYFPPRTAALDNDRLKQAVMDYGAIWADMVFTAAAYNAPQAAYLNTGTEGETRAVAIAGWDDSFDRAKFSPPAPGNGAFLCKNSLGSAWGSGGYFYVSYYDAFLARRYFSAAFTAEPKAGYTVQYAYDPNGCTSRLGFDADAGWFASQFVASSADPLAAVGFYAFTAAGTYEILIYKDAVPGRPRSGSLALRQTGSFSTPGFMTIPLTTSLPLLLNQRFSVVVRLQTDGDEFPIPLEHPIADMTAAFTANPGEGFISPDGAVWTDLTAADGTKYARTSLCLKAYAGYPAAYPPAELKVERLTNNFFFFKEYVDKLTWLANPKNTAAVSKYRIYRRAQADTDAAFALLGETISTQLIFFVRAVKKDDAFVYRVTAVLADGRESDPAEFSI
ncbi:MAG: lectin like domain-containing protein [Candidatus Aminicenantes bacterium]|nr:lectin like domain-containing protein [Candidatus Aminicenantes bacterium]